MMSSARCSVQGSEYSLIVSRAFGTSGRHGIRGSVLAFTAQKAILKQDNNFGLWYATEVLVAALFRSHQRSGRTVEQGRRSHLDMAFSHRLARSWPLRELYSCLFCAPYAHGAFLRTRFKATLKPLGIAKIHGRRVCQLSNTALPQAIKAFFDWHLWNRRCGPSAARYLGSSCRRQWQQRSRV